MQCFRSKRNSLRQKHRQTQEKAQGHAQSVSNLQGNEPSSLYLILLVLSMSKEPYEDNLR